MAATGGGPRPPRVYLGALTEMLREIEASYAAADAKGAGAAGDAGNTISLGGTDRVNAGGDVVRAVQPSVVGQGAGVAVTGPDRPA